MKHLLILVAFMLAACVSSAATPAETNAVARALLIGVVSRYYEDNIEDTNAQTLIEPIGAWGGFLAGYSSEGWSDDAKKAAFAQWLLSFGTKDCSSLSMEDVAFVSLAIDQCEALDFRESAPALKALADNPKGVFREEARKLWQKWQPQE